MKALVLTLALCSTTALSSGLAARTHAWSAAAGAVGGGLISMLLIGSPHGHAIVEIIEGACLGASVSVALVVIAAEIDELTPGEKRIVDRLLERLPRNR